MKPVIDLTGKKFGLWHQTIRYWMKKYGPEIAIQKAKEKQNGLFL